MCLCLLGTLNGLALGADHVMDYRVQDYARGDARYDFVLDFELHRSALACRHVLSPHGQVTFVGGAGLRLLEAVVVGSWVARLRGQRMNVLMHKANKDLGQLAQLAAEGKIHAAIEREYALHEVPEALSRMCAGAVVGKAVIVIAS
jgi:NADPH:quinone reductase-like Zn-dependent oxidoreductase